MKNRRKRFFLVSKGEKVYLTPFKLKDDSEVKLNIDYTWMYKKIIELQTKKRITHEMQFNE